MVSCVSVDYNIIYGDDTLTIKKNLKKHIDITSYTNILRTEGWAAHVYIVSYKIAIQWIELSTKHNGIIQNCDISIIDVQFLYNIATYSEYENYLTTIRNTM